MKEREALNEYMKFIPSSYIDWDWARVMEFKRAVGFARKVLAEDNPRKIHNALERLEAFYRP